MIYFNEFAIKVRRANMMDIVCGKCKTYVATYQKEGKGKIIHLYENRITESAVDLREVGNALFCPNCQFKLGVKTVSGGDIAFRMIPGAFNRKKK